ncbi:MAG TPA: DUF4011 domain-containing protein [Solirubrobacterales bacterium]|nr:DUF4011 domain-containing protein [Solirubrobacterales bacterium]
MSIDISGSDWVEVVGESFYRSALRRIAEGIDDDNRMRVATLIPEPTNPYDRHAVRVMIDEEQVGHLPKALAAIVAGQISELTRADGEVTATAEVRGSADSELGCGVVLAMDLARLNAGLVDEGEEDSSLDLRLDESLVAGEEPVPSAALAKEAHAPDDRARRQTIERAIEDWKTELIDLSGRNRLLYMRDLKTGTLSFDVSARDALLTLISGKRVALSKIIPRSKMADSPQAKLTPFEDAVRRMRTIVRTARSYEEERGVRTLFLACGVATWKNDRPTSSPASPVLLVPLAIRARGSSQQDFDLELAGDLEVNPTLLHMLKVEFNLQVDEGELYEHSEMDGVIDTPEELRLAFDWLSKRCAAVPGWAIVDRFILGNFWYAKLPMVKDLERSVELLASHDVAAAFAGDQGARKSLLEVRDTSGADSAGAVDDLLPASEFNVLDSDSSQSLAIARARLGENLVLKGPPGTGKSQTIANLICNAIGEGKRILFVAEKRAAIEVVTKRLRAAGLGDLVLDLHQGAESRKWLAAQLGDSLAAVRSTGEVVREVEQAQLVRARQSLRSHVEELHTVREPWGLSVFQAQMQLLERGRPTLSARLRGPDLEKVGEANLAELDEKLRDLLALDGLSLRAKDSPWALAEVKAVEDAREAVETVDRLCELLDQIEPGLQTAADQTSVKRPHGLREAIEAVTIWNEAKSCLALFEPSIFDSDLEPAVQALQPLQGSALARLFASLGSAEFRQVRATVQGRLHAGEEVDSHQLYDALLTCKELQPRMDALRTDDSLPSVPADLAELEEGVAEFRDRVASLGGIVGVELTSLSFVDARAQLSALQTDAATVMTLPRISAAREGFKAVGLGGFLTELEEDQTLVADARAELGRLWWQSLADHLMMLPSADGLATFRGGLHQQLADEFRELDCRHIEAAAQHVKRAAAEGAVAAQDRFPEQAQLVRAQAQRKRGHLPVRELFAKAPDVVTSLRPCWVMSPLMVSQLIPSERTYFDIVVFDEASQVRPVDALTSMIRGGQLVVAGDERQLPPTTFFDATGSADGPKSDGDEDATEIADYESLLDVLMTLFETEMLRWHYRSRDERLIGFSNREIYDGRLTTFPGVVDGEVLRHVLVNEPPTEDESRVSPAAEVAEVVQLVIEHARSRPEESLGVIALGIQHAEAIEAGLLNAMPDYPDLEPFFSEEQEERFFVKNLERVQGDERDAIILAIGYGKTPGGVLPHRFGPLNNVGGERRLNVAVTRAKRRMTVVSSFRADDIDTSRSGAEGVRLLQAFLTYVAAGGEASEADSGQAGATPLHRLIATALETGGYGSSELLGTSADRIDVAVVSPERGLPVVAIEVDGETYARRPSVRDRDRLRTDQLRRLGWAHIFTWSQDWYRDPAETARILLQEVAQSLNGGTAGEGQGDDPEGPRNPEGSEAAPAEPRDRGPRPNLPSVTSSITDWRQRDLVELAEWIESDGLLRTGEELKDELMKEIGISRRGSRVVSVLDRVAIVVRGHSS